DAIYERMSCGKTKESTRCRQRRSLLSEQRILGWQYPYPLCGCWNYYHRFICFREDGRKKSVLVGLLLSDLNHISIFIKESIFEYQEEKYRYCDFGITQSDKISQLESSEDLAGVCILLNYLPR
ncbi:hypothetical protein J6590_103007, partial [Homalodisca vitripennis]